jgi:hypothetical protein
MSATDYKTTSVIKTLEGIEKETITIALHHYGREIVNNVSCFKCCGKTSDILAKNCWGEMKKKRQSSYTFWYPGSQRLHNGDCPCMDIVVPTRKALLTLAAEAHAIGEEYVGVDKHGTRYGYHSSSLNPEVLATFEAHQGPFWDVRCWWMKHGAEWRWWGKDSGYFRDVPPHGNRIMVFAH